ncbi:hypothetical protein FR932_01685 [Moritella marina ATCC 15381]|uniref:4-alpha-glucanotransferase n=1 Tax=Moritella marina ATCC 15381 TaxID=1202962 RepID=A0A5J6WGI5_MORMI|nr:hypothetical protein [Moritella marina]QFI36634.1 hypothetical protein FR932_01685 [Moritella marina ATCC 15381]
MTAQHILQLGQMLGLSCTELNANGDEQALPITLVTQALADFGFTDELALKLEEEIKQFWLRALPPVMIADESAMIQFDLHLPIEFVTEDLIWEVRANQVVIETGEFTPIEWSLNGIYHLHDMEMQSYQISLEQPLAVGSYHLVILDQGSEEPLGESWIVNPPATLTPTIVTALPTKTTALPTTESVLNQLLTYTQPSLATTVITGSTPLVQQLQQQFNHDKEQAEFALTLKTVIAGASPLQTYLAQYLTAYATDGLTATHQETQTVEWQAAHSDGYAFYLWLVVTANNTLTGKASLRSMDFAIDAANTGSFAHWLLADYQLAHCQLDNVLAGVVDQGTVNHGINSYKLRQDGYAAFRALVDFTTMQSAGLLLNQPLSIMQQWLTIGDAGIWQNHEFNELLSIILLSCERHACACYYQADDELPAELTAYLDARGIQPLSL